MSSVDISNIQAMITSGYARQSRNIETWRDVLRAEIKCYDHDYGIELGAVKEDALRLASRGDMVRLVNEACREPTSLEILYYAQVGGPHVTAVQQ